MIFFSNSPLQRGLKVGLVLLLSSLFSMNHLMADSDSVHASTPLSSANSATALDEISLLSQMQKAITQSNYQLYFYTIENLLTLSQANTFRYQHVNDQGIEKASLVGLDGAPKEIILNDGVMSYFQSEMSPFSLRGQYIVEIFPTFVYSDFESLKKHYTFHEIGSARIANHYTHAIRMNPKQEDRYSYLIWIDQESYLPLRIDLLDLNDNMIQQFKAIHLVSQFDPAPFIDYIDDHDISIPIEIEKEKNITSNTWHLNWLPSGFEKLSDYTIFYESNDMNTRMYSDGVFSFTITVSENTTEGATPLESKQLSHPVEIESTISIYTIDKGSTTIIVIGNLPLTTLKKIAINTVYKKN